MLGLPAPFVPHSASLRPATATRVLSTLVPVFAPPTSLDVFIFYFLGVSPPCCSILCQFWLCEEAQCVYLRRYLGSPSLAFTVTSSVTEWCLFLLLEILKRGHTPRFLLVGLLNIQDPGLGSSQGEGVWVVFWAETSWLHGFS